MTLVILTAIAAWILVPIPFVRGLSAGVFAVILTIVAFFKYMEYRTKKRGPLPLDPPV